MSAKTRTRTRTRTRMRTRMNRRKTKTRRGRIFQVGCSKKTRRNRRSLKQRGGYGPGSNPLQGAPWTAADGGNYYATSALGVSPGGHAPYYAQNATPSPQHGGIGLPSFLSEPYYSSTTSLGNLVRQFSGKHQIASSNPMYQTL